MIFYLGWNIWWISKREVPPSILKYYTGIPVPTTGMTRSVRSVLNGHVSAFFYWNPFTVPILLLLGLTVGYVTYRWYRDQLIDLPGYLSGGWAVILPVAWLVKLLQGPSWW